MQPALLRGGSGGAGTLLILTLPCPKTRRCRAPGATPRSPPRPGLLVAGRGMEKQLPAMDERIGDPNSQQPFTKIWMGGVLPASEAAQLTQGNGLGTGVLWGRCSSSPSGGCPCPKSLTSGVHPPLTSGGGTSAKEGFFLGGGTRGDSPFPPRCREQSAAEPRASPGAQLLRPPAHFEPPGRGCAQVGNAAVLPPPRRASIGPIGHRAGVEGGGKPSPRAGNRWLEAAC